MAEAQSPERSAGAAGTADGPKILIENQYVKDLSFENPKALEALAAEARPEIKIGVEVRARPAENGRYEVELGIKAEALRAAQALFVIELTYAGLVSVQGVKPEMLQPVLLIEGPRLLFPFARRIVADMVRDGGFPPLMLNPIDFVQLYRQNLAARGGAKGDGAGTPAAN